MGGKYIREIKPELWPDITFEWLVECVYMYKYSVSLRHGCALFWAFWEICVISLGLLKGGTQILQISSLIDQTI